MHTRSVMGGGLRIPRLLVSIQIALCLTALVAAGLLGRSLENLKWVDVGFDRENLAYASVNPGRVGYMPERTKAYVNRVREELTRVPGVLQVSTLRVRLLSGGGQRSRASFPGRPAPGSLSLETNSVDVNHVGDGLLETLRIRLVAGRTLEARASGNSGNFWKQICLTIARYQIASR